jgi:hypothetical protein
MDSCLLLIGAMKFLLDVSVLSLQCFVLLLKPVSLWLSIDRVVRLRPSNVARFWERVGRCVVSSIKVRVSAKDEGGLETQGIISMRVLILKRLSAGLIKERVKFERRSQSLSINRWEMLFIFSKEISILISLLSESVYSILIIVGVGTDPWGVLLLLLLSGRKRP